VGWMNQSYTVCCKVCSKQTVESFFVANVSKTVDFTYKNNQRSREKLSGKLFQKLKSLIETSKFNEAFEHAS
jgi:hypothetical protein